MTMHVKDAGIWKTASPRVKDGGVWKTVQTGSVKDSGVWKPFFNNLTFTLIASTYYIAENGSITFTVNSSQPLNATWVTYQIKDYIGDGQWGTADYNVSSYDNAKPDGVIYFNGNISTQSFSVQHLLDSNEPTEYYYVDIRLGYYAYASPVVATTLPNYISVQNTASCIWALYGRPEWC